MIYKKRKEKFSSIHRQSLLLGGLILISLQADNKKEKLFILKSKHQSKKDEK